MLAETLNGHDRIPQVTLVGESGIQFMDFAFRIDKADMAQRTEFARLGNGLCVLLAEHDGRLTYKNEAGEPVQVKSAALDCLLKDSVALLDGQWLPLPFFRLHAGDRFENGPGNWARFRLKTLGEPDLDGNTHRLTLAFDTRVDVSDRDTTAYLAPN